ncbi:hypothetical protein [Mucilaginibacter lacusdianchii]|uniref:hypothetical protein n=1 Tax=Mucilaginibacter lacusdianchii TaxID=2684211 RepID=UPI00131DDC88|nr:hypothetical protein [Mucilaginibacter sp. JXJ CY 39]
MKNGLYHQLFVMLNFVIIAITAGELEASGLSFNLLSIIWILTLAVLLYVINWIFNKFNLSFNQAWQILLQYAVTFILVHFVLLIVVLKRLSIGEVAQVYFNEDLSMLFIIPYIISIVITLVAYWWLQLNVHAQE